MQIGDRASKSIDLQNLGVAYAELGDAKKAIEYYEQHLAIAREIGDSRGEGSALWNASLALDVLGRRAEAVKLARDALAIFERIGDPYAEEMRQKLAKWQDNLTHSKPCRPP